MAMSKDQEEAGYALAKQLGKMEYIHTSYGNINLTEEMKEAVIKALTPILKRQFKDSDG